MSRGTYVQIVHVDMPLLTVHTSQYGSDRDSRLPCTLASSLRRGWDENMSGGTSTVRSVTDTQIRCRDCPGGGGGLWQR